MLRAAVARGGSALVLVLLWVWQAQSLDKKPAAAPAAGGRKPKTFEKIDPTTDRKAREARQRLRRIQDIRERRIPERKFWNPDDDDDLYDHGMGLDDDDDFYYEKHMRGRQRARAKGEDFDENYDPDHKYRRGRDEEEDKEWARERLIRRTVKAHAMERLDLFESKREIEDGDKKSKKDKVKELDEIYDKIRDLDNRARAFAEEHSDRIGTTSTTTLPPRRPAFIPSGDPEADLIRRRKERDKRFKERKKRRAAREKKMGGRGGRYRRRSPDNYDEGEGREDQVDRELDSVNTQVEKLIKRAKAANYSEDGFEVIMQHINLFKEDEYDRVDDMAAMEADFLYENKEVDEDGNQLQLTQWEKDRRRDSQKRRRDDQKAWEDRMKKRRFEIHDLIEDQEHIDDPPPYISGRDCYKKCKEQSGQCDWCGDGNLCCRKNSHRDPPECQELHHLQKWIGKHTCVRPQDIDSAPVAPEDIVYEITDADDEEGGEGSETKEEDEEDEEEDEEEEDEEEDEEEGADEDTHPDL
mmetsp:Transcript_6100/g.13533  ORF Transcript_6100/g.13533 Transcript_6100/m.13533 type:complete len:525 (-) Transcript_6100:47-1621(-)